MRDEKISHFIIKSNTFSFIWEKDIKDMVTGKIRGSNKFTF